MIPDFSTLDELVEAGRNITYGVVKPGPEVSDGIRFVRGGDVFKGRIAIKELRTISPQLSDQYKRTLLRGGELLVSLVGNPGEVAIVPSELTGANIARQVGLVPLTSEVNPRFVMYYLQSPQGRAELFVRTQGAVQQVINLADLKKVKIPRWPCHLQDRIVEILSAYDDLIENNQRRIHLLEQAARLLYKEWFVNLRFPGHEHTRIIDGVPEGWVEKPLNEIAEITMGQSPKSMYYNEEGIGLPFHQGVTNFGFRFPAREIYCTVQNRLAESGDILFSVRAPVGRLNIAQEKIVIGRGLAAIRSNRSQQNLLYYMLKSHFFKEDMMGGGAIFAAITKKDLHDVTLLQPSGQLAGMFMDYIVPIDLQITNLQQTIERLGKVRDLILPRIMDARFAI